MIVTATGLAMQAPGGAELLVDGRKVEAGGTLACKGVMISCVPNLASVFGYINASWTLKADLMGAYVCRMLNLMDRRGVQQVTPTRGEEKAAASFVQNFSSGYRERARWMTAYWCSESRSLSSSYAPWRSLMPGPPGSLAILLPAQGARSV